MRRTGSVFFVVSIIALFYLSFLPVSASTSHVDVIQVKGVINPVTSSYIQRGISEAEEDGARALIIEIDTPGGLDTSMREIIQRIISAKVPIVVYVSPPGGRAASAGLFILLSGHVAAMSPNTSTGSAHPVGIGDQQPDQTMSDKITNDAVSFIKGLAIRYGRNAEWAERAVRESVSVTDQEALQIGVIDVRADNLNHLLELVDGREVILSSGSIRLETKAVTVKYIDMDLVERFLYLISDPNIAYILMSIAMTALFLELSNPGAILPGIVGGIALLLAIFSFGMLPVNFVGVLLVIFGFLLFLAEVKMVSHGMLTVGGIIAMVLGSMMLINSSAPYFTISRWVIAGVVLTVSSFFFYAVGKAVRIQKKKTTTGWEGLIGEKGVTRSDLNPKGMVFLEGELWEAESTNGRIEKDSAVMVTRVDGLKLWVTPTNQ